jgi:hypothetical protein
MSGENLDYSPKLPEVGSKEGNAEETEPGLMEVVDTHLDGTIPFEGKITEIEIDDAGVKRYTVEGSENTGKKIKEVGLRGEDLKRFVPTPKTE